MAWNPRGFVVATGESGRQGPAAGAKLGDVHDLLGDVCEAVIANPRPFHLVRHGNAHLVVSHLVVLNDHVAKPAVAGGESKSGGD